MTQVAARHKQHVLVSRGQHFHQLDSLVDVDEPVFNGSDRLCS
jgi:hypothetical protein